MLTWIASLAIVGMLAYNRGYNSGHRTVPHKRAFSDLRTLASVVWLSPERDKYAELLSRYRWIDDPECTELVNKLLAAGYWRENFWMTDGKNTIELSAGKAGYTAVVTNPKQKTSTYWLPQRFHEGFMNQLA